MTDRRTVLRTLLGGAAAAALPGQALLAGTGKRPVSDVAILNGALVIEHTAIYAYSLAGGSGLCSPAALAVGGTFKGSHEQHRDSLMKVIKGLGGFPIGPDQSYDFKAFDLKTEVDVLHLALFLELQAAHAYTAALAGLRHHGVLASAARILGDEVSHAAALRAVLGKAPVPFWSMLQEGLE